MIGLLAVGALLTGHGRADPLGRFALTAERTTALNLVQIAAWLAFAGPRLIANGHFLKDEAVFFETALTVARTGQLAANGPYISGTNPVAYTPGGALFDLLAPPFLFTSDPRWGVAWVILLSGLGLVLLDRALLRLTAAPRLRLFAVTLAAWGIWHARFADRIWNAHLFLFATPLLLWIAAGLRTAAGRRPLWALAFGAVAGLLLQLHLSGAVAVALGAVVALPGLRRRELLPLAGCALAGLIFLYLPWIAAEWPRGFADLAQLRQGRPRGRWLGSAVGRSFAVFLKFASQDGRWRPEQPPPAGSSLADWLGYASFWVTGALLPLGLWVRSSWRTACAVGVLLVPLFLAVSGRDYYDHYVIAAYPFYFLPPAAALSLLAGRSGPWRAAVASYLAIFVGLGVWFVSQEYRPQASDWTIGMQREITLRLLDLGGPIAPRGESLLAAQPEIYRALSEALFQRPLLDDPLAGIPCDLTDVPPRDPRLTAWAIGGGRHFLTCARPGRAAPPGPLKP